MPRLADLLDLHATLRFVVKFISTMHFVECMSCNQYFARIIETQLKNHDFNLTGDQDCHRTSTRTVAFATKWAAALVKLKH